MHEFGNFRHSHTTNLPLSRRSQCWSLLTRSIGVIPLSRRLVSSLDFTLAFRLSSLGLESFLAQLKPLLSLSAHYINLMEERSPIPSRGGESYAAKQNTSGEDLQAKHQRSVGQRGAIHVIVPTSAPRISGRHEERPNRSLVWSGSCLSSLVDKASRLGSGRILNWLATLVSGR